MDPECQFHLIANEFMLLRQFVQTFGEAKPASQKELSKRQSGGLEEPQSGSFVILDP